MTIASWLVTVDPKSRAAVRASLKRPGVDCRCEARDSLIVVTETADVDPELRTVHESLASLPGVRQADLVARFDESDPSGRLHVLRSAW